MRGDREHGIVRIFLYTLHTARTTWWRPDRELVSSSAVHKMLLQAEQAEDPYIESCSMS